MSGYPSGPGWDACTGLGVIDGGALLAALQGVYLQDCQFIVDRTQIGEGRGRRHPVTGASPALSSAFFVVADGFNAKSLGIAQAT